VLGTSSFSNQPKDREIYYVEREVVALASLIRHGHEKHDHTTRPRCEYTDITLYLPILNVHSITLLGKNLVACRLEREQASRPGIEHFDILGAGDKGFQWTESRLGSPIHALGTLSYVKSGSWALSNPRFFSLLRTSPLPSCSYLSPREPPATHLPAKSLPLVTLVALENAVASSSPPDR
jgi:hypothetical protein